MASIRQRYHKFDAKVRIPRALRETLGGKEFLTRRLEATTRQGAKVEAATWEAALRSAWAEKKGEDAPREQLRALYDQTKADALRGRYLVDTPGEDPIDAGIDYEIDRIAEAVGPEADPSPLQQVRLNALSDAQRELNGQPSVRRKELELSVRELADLYMKSWTAQRGLKPSNTAQQKEATYSLFCGYWGDRPLREVTRPVAATFLDTLRRLEPAWARSPEARGMPWGELVATYGDRQQGLSDSTMNRHAATLGALWEWAADRGHCEGRNPFKGFNRRLRQGVNVDGYLAWDTGELEQLLTPPPKRRDLHEVIIVGLFTGMRLNEIAALHWSDVRNAEGVTYFQIRDAKSPAGNRQVPVHPALGWLLERREGSLPGDRLWPTFNPEGPGKKPGADAGREFSRFKAARGFTDRRKAFHSFRKNVTRQMERAGVPENEWAQVFGHEKGFTYGRYNPDGIELERKAEIIRLISYPGLPVGLEKA